MRPCTQGVELFSTWQVTQNFCTNAVISLGVNQTASTIGGLAVGVPGEMRGEQIQFLLAQRRDIST